MDRYTEKIIRKFDYNPDKSVVYQSFKQFLYPTFFIEKINPEHKAVLYAKKKKRFAKSKTRNYEKIALLFKCMLPTYLLLYFTILTISAFTSNLTAIDIVAHTTALISILIFFSVIHELLHIRMFEKFNIPYSIKPKPEKLPAVVQLQSSYFDKPFNKLDTLKKKQYTCIAIAPYIIILPCAVLLMFVFQPAGLILLFSHILNLPLEFIM